MLETKRYKEWVKVSTSLSLRFGTSMVLMNEEHGKQELEGSKGECSLTLKDLPERSVSVRSADETEEKFEHAKLKERVCDQKELGN